MACSTAYLSVWWTDSCVPIGSTRQYTQSLRIWPLCTQYTWWRPEAHEIFMNGSQTRKCGVTKAHYCQEMYSWKSAFTNHPWKMHKRTRIANTPILTTYSSTCEMRPLLNVSRTVHVASYRREGHFQIFCMVICSILLSSLNITLSPVLQILHKPMISAIQVFLNTSVPRQLDK